MINKRLFLAGLASSAVIVPSISSAECAEGSNPLKFADPDGPFIVVPYTTESAHKYQKEHGAIIVLVSDGKKLSKNQFKSILAAFEDNKSKTLPLLVLASEAIDITPESKDWNPVPGLVVVVRDGFMEARREDSLSKSDVRFLIDAVGTDERCQG